MTEWHNAEQHAERAHQFYESGQWEKALAELKCALTVNPNQSDWHFGMGLTLSAMQCYAEAAGSFQRVLRLRGDDVETLLHLGFDLIQCDRGPKAIEVLRRALEIDPDCERAYCYLILAHSNLGEHDDAEVAFYMARQLVDDCPICYDHLAQSLSARRQVDRAIWCWQQTLKLDPHHPDVFAHLAGACWTQGKLRRARRLYVQQIRRDPGDTDTLLDLGNLLIEMEQFAEAGEKFRRALELDPTLAEAHLKLGELALLTGHLDAAAAELGTARSLAPEQRGVHLRLAEVAQRRGRLGRARDHLRTELDLGGHNPAEALELAEMLIDLEMPAKAVGVLTPLIDGPKGDQRTAALFSRGLAHLLCERPSMCIDDCRRALHLVPDHTAAMHHLVLAHLELGQMRRARCWLARMAPLCRRDPDFRALRCRVAGGALKTAVHRLLRRPRQARVR